MNLTNESEIHGQVASLHLHPSQPGVLMESAEYIDVVENKGIAGNRRYFDRLDRLTQQPSKRQVSLIEREQLAEHASALGEVQFAPGAVRANIETTGIRLIPLIHCEIEIGEAVLLICTARTPCAKMDAVCRGLRELMKENRQGVLAQVIRSGRIRVGDTLRLLKRIPQAAVPW